MRVCVYERGSYDRQWDQKVEKKTKEEKWKGQSHALKWRNNKKEDEVDFSWL